MSGLSSRVMNMKFMQKTDDYSKKSNNKDNDQSAKVKDASEWGLPKSDTIKARLSQKNRVVESIGYASINSFDQVNHADDAELDNDSDSDDFAAVPANGGRRTFGGKKVEKSEEPIELGNIKGEKDKKTTPKVKGTKTLNKLDSKKDTGYNRDPAEPELGTKAFLDSLWNKSNKPAEQPQASQKRKPESQDAYKPDVKNKRKRFNNLS